MKNHGHLGWNDPLTTNSSIHARQSMYTPLTNCMYKPLTTISKFILVFWHHENNHLHDVFLWLPYTAHWFEPVLWSLVVVSIWIISKSLHVDDFLFIVVLIRSNRFWGGSCRKSLKPLRVYQLTVGPWPLLLPLLLSDHA